ncbi:protein TOC75, chloroplastic [Selaginella moellendorffii]|uniref:protein TOC75, chloroplastic n=1 Tax=Selaginella moellendorffii TaxID=88036 RepID=UPI000D1C6415|nr:protein TOC75, chloroplastic [Selaginella moellendorffii]|eukprot:XP_024538647.1 protein TOC75, chloroplastic [Selaginella moellendorffii]
MSCCSIQALGTAAPAAARFDLHSHRARLELVFHTPFDLPPVAPVRTCSLGFFKKITSLAGAPGNPSKPRGESGNPIESTPFTGAGGGSGGNRGNSGNDSGFQEHDGWDFSLPSGRVSSSMVEETQEEESSSSVPARIRAFYCVNVGPVSDDHGWRAFAREDELWGPCLLPCFVQADITSQLVRRGCYGDRNTLVWIKEEVENWYRRQGFGLAKVRGFTGSSTGVLCCRVSEGTITDTRVSFKDVEGNAIQGLTSRETIFRELPRTVMEGMPYNSNAIKQALQSLRQLQLFEKVNVDVRRNDLDGVSLRFFIQEKPQDACDFQTGLSFFSSDSGKPILASIRPAGTLSVEHRNIAGKNRTLHGSINSNDLLRPQDDSQFKLEYAHPYVDGPKDKIFRVGCYNSRKLTAVLSHPTSREQTPVVWVDHAGFKTGITEKLSKGSKLVYGFVVEEVSTRDVLGPVQTLDDRDLLADGIDRVPFLNVKITRDNTRLVHRARVGAIDTFQVDQGVGLGSKTTSFFNKHLLSTTRFLPLPSTTPDSFPLVILRARYGGMLGMAPSYLAFANPRASNASCWSFFELMAEARVPIRRQHYAYSYVESFAALDRGVRFWRNEDTGILLGLGVKVGEIRAEYVFDSSTRTGSLNVQMGDRV